MAQLTGSGPGNGTNYLYYDTDGSSYWFVNGQDRRQVVSQEAYLMIYLIEIMKGENVNG